MRLAFMSSATTGPARSDLPEISSAFPDRITLWFGYPLGKDPLVYRPVLYLQERCSLASLFREMHSLIFTDGGQRGETVAGLASEVESLSAKLRLWYDELPMDLAYEWPMSIAVWELQCVSKTLRILHFRSGVTNKHSQCIIPCLFDATSNRSKDSIAAARAEQYGLTSSA